MNMMLWNHTRHEGFDWWISEEGYQIMKYDCEDYYSAGINIGHAYLMLGDGATFSEAVELCEEHRKEDTARLSAECLPE
jgi:hypothetical protein